MRLKTIPIRIEDHFLSREEMDQLWREMAPEGTSEQLIVAVDGAPGTGKSIFSELLASKLRKMGVEVGIVPTDLDCLPWSERPEGSSLMDWHGNTLTREAIAHPGCVIPYQGYDVVSHERTRDDLIFSPKRGVLIVEGLHAIEFVCESSNGPVIAVPFQISNELREIRRAERNIRQGRWKSEQVESRTAAQRPSALDFYGDLGREIIKTSSTIHNTIRVFD